MASSVSHFSIDRPSQEAPHVQHVPLLGEVDTEGLDHYAVAMKDPEGNEFDIN